MDREPFEQLVSEGIATIPARFKKLLKNIAIVIEDTPTPSQLQRGGVRSGSLLLGLYEGVPRASRFGHEPIMPDKITIFQQPIEMVAQTPEAIRDQVSRTVWHEIGHHFGLSEQAVRGAERRKRNSQD